MRNIQMTLVVVVVVLAASGCAATSEPVLNTEPINVTRDELDRFWQPDTPGGGVYVRVPPMPPGVPCGVVDYRMLIDSTGKVHDVEVIDAYPRRSFEEAAREQAEARRYRPADTNAARTPVRVQTYVTFDTDSADDIDCDALARERLSRAE